MLRPVQLHATQLQPGCAKCSCVVRCTALLNAHVAQLSTPIAHRKPHTAAAATTAACNQASVQAPKHVLSLLQEKDPSKEKKEKKDKPESKDSKDKKEKKVHNQLAGISSS